MVFVPRIRVRDWGVLVFRVFDIVGGGGIFSRRVSDLSGVSEQFFS